MEVALGILGVLLFGTVVYLIGRGAADRTARTQAEALRATEKARRVALEEAADAERRARAVELNDATANVRTVDDAVRLVREQLSRRRTRRTL